MIVHVRLLGKIINLFQYTRVILGLLWLGDNDWGGAGVVCEAPEWSRRMMQLKPERSESFYGTIRPGTEGALQTTPEQPGHYSHYNTKLANSRYFHWKLCCIALNEPDVMANLLLEIYWALSLSPCFKNRNRTEGIKLGPKTDLLGLISMLSIRM